MLMSRSVTFFLWKTLTKYCHSCSRRTLFSKIMLVWLSRAHGGQRKCSCSSSKTVSYSSSSTTKSQFITLHIPWRMIPMQDPNSNSKKELFFCFLRTLLTFFRVPVSLTSLTHRQIMQFSRGYKRFQSKKRKIPILITTLPEKMELLNFLPPFLKVLWRSSVADAETHSQTRLVNYSNKDKMYSLYTATANLLQ
jgi:hypothetical protein